MREAGGYVSDYAGRDLALKSGEVLAANDQLHMVLSKIIMQVRKARAAQG